MPQHRPDYLSPYLRSTQKHGPTFRSLLWASPSTQAARFDAFTRLYDFHGATMIDAGCGRADLLPFLLDRNLPPATYLGLEAVPALADAARQTVQSLTPDRSPRSRDASPPPYRILSLDFVKDPSALDHDADVLVFSGALNTLDRPTFYATLERAFHAAKRAVVFNFLSSSHLAAADWLTWHPPHAVESFARKLTRNVASLSDYLDGDQTLCLYK